MAYPPQPEVEAALVEELRRRGKPTWPADLYTPLADRFNLSDNDRTRLRADRGNERLWNNKVQWARRRLVERGVMPYRPHRAWALTEWDNS